MNVEGVDIQQGVIDRAVLSFPIDRTFSMRELQAELIRGGVPRDASERCADRVLQNLRRAGTHVHVGKGKWKRRKIVAS